MIGYVRQDGGEAAHLSRTDAFGDESRNLRREKAIGEVLSCDQHCAQMADQGAGGNLGVEIFDPCFKELEQPENGEKTCIR